MQEPRSRQRPRLGAGDELELRGVLARVRFEREGFMVGELADGSVIRGRMRAPEAGLEYTLRGRWEDDPRFGRQFAFQGYTEVRPRDPGAVARYLMQHGPGIGERIASRLVERYGAEAIEICREDPARVAREIVGLTPARAARIAAALGERAAREASELEVMRLLERARVPRPVVERILDLCGGDAAAQIRSDPYGLIQTIPGVGFTTADAIARQVGYPSEDPRRLRAGVWHVASDEAHQAGHTCLPESELRARAAELLGVGPERAQLGIDALVREGELVTRDARLALRSHDQAEATIARRILALAGPRPLPSSPDFEGLAPDQQRALGPALGSGVFILTGGPGTGKSHMIRRILDAFSGAHVALAAPTGKAAKRMAELTGREGQTLHRLLEPVPSRDGGFWFQRHSGNPIEADLIVLDEVSMIDVPLMARFLEAVPARARLILVGDTQQLPAVGPGNVLGDLIASGCVPCVELTEIKRQDEGLIVRNCHRIRRGEALRIDNAHARDFFFAERGSEEEIRAEVLSLVAARLPERFGADPLRDIQVLVPRRARGALSCEALNRDLQERLNPHRPAERARFAMGDKVLQTRNNYALGVFNGDIGTVRLIHGRSMVVSFDNPDRRVDMDLHRNDLELAYAVTVHKFQGSEARIVVIPIHPSAGPLLLQRSWLYTAVSRAREVCVLVGHPAEAERAIHRDRQQRRFTQLEHLLRARGASAPAARARALPAGGA